MVIHKKEASKKIPNILGILIFLVAAATLFFYLRSKQNTVFEEPFTTSIDTGSFQLLQKQIMDSGLKIEELHGPDTITYRIHGTLAEPVGWVEDLLKGKILIEGDKNNFPIYFNLGLKTSQVGVGEQKENTVTYEMKPVNEVPNILGDRKKVVLQLSFPKDISSLKPDSSAYLFAQQQQQVHNHIQQFATEGTPSFGDTNELFVSQITILE